MRRLLVLLLALPALLAACGGEDWSAEVEQLQSDVEALQAVVAVLATGLDVAKGERDRLAEELAAARADVERQTTIAEAADEAPVAQAADAEAATAAAPGTVPGASADGEVYFYFEQVVDLTQTFGARGEDLAEAIDRVASTGDLEATKALFHDLAQLQAELAGAADAIDPPGALAAPHAAAVAAEQGLAQAMAGYALAVAAVSTWDEFEAVVGNYVQGPEFQAALAKSSAACLTLQDAAAARGIMLDLDCGEF